LVFNLIESGKERSGTCVIGKGLADAHAEDELSLLCGHAHAEERFLDFFIGSMARDHQPLSARDKALWADLLVQRAGFVTILNKVDGD